jgi:hypothetical protein
MPSASWHCGVELAPPGTREEIPVTSLPIVVPERPLGIVTRNGTTPTRGASIWAYMWAADEEDTPHWHDLVPREHVA